MTQHMTLAQAAEYTIRIIQGLANDDPSVSLAIANECEEHFKASYFTRKFPAANGGVVIPFGDSSNTSQDVKVERHFFHKLEKIMGKFLDGIKDDIDKIHTDAEVDAEITEQVKTAMTTALEPVEAEIKDLQDALTQVVGKLKEGDTAGAQAIADQAVAASSASAAGADTAGAANGESSAG